MDLITIIIDHQEFLVPNDINEKLIYYKRIGNCIAFNALLAYIQDAYIVLRRIENIYYII